jgi:hypothetical protein
MSDGPVLTSYPHDRLSRLADAMTEALDRVPGTGDVRAIVMLDDGEGGCVHPHNYPDPVGPRNAALFIDTTAHLMAMGRALGVRVDVLINGKKLGGAPSETQNAPPRPA